MTNSSGSGPLNTQPGDPNSLGAPSGYRVNHVSFCIVTAAVALLLAVIIIYIAAPYFNQLSIKSSQPQMVNYVKVASHWIGGTAVGLVLKNLWDEFKKMFG